MPNHKFILHKVLEGKLQTKEVSYTHKKIQTIDDLMAANAKEGKNTHNDITDNKI